jgi:hypothetical protein
LNLAAAAPLADAVAGLNLAAAAPLADAVAGLNLAAMSLLDGALKLLDAATTFSPADALEKDEREHERRLEKDALELKDDVATVLDRDKLARVVDPSQLEAVMVAAVVVVLTLIMRAKLEEALAGLAEALLRETIFLVRMAAEAQDESAELRGILGLATAGSVLAWLGALVRRIWTVPDSEGDSGDGKTDEDDKD